jgi:predicted XRE-type DNA-binding protein
LAKHPKHGGGGEVFDNVWDALCDTPEEAANLTLRSDLMSQIGEIVKKSGWTQVEAARRCGVSRPRVNELLRGHIDSFSLDSLIDIATALGRKVEIKLEAA